MLEKISVNELISDIDSDNGRAMTFLALENSEAVNYRLKTRFKTIKQGLLIIEVEYCGRVEADMRVCQYLDGEKRGYVYTFDSNIFLGFMESFLKRHRETLGHPHDFRADDLVLDLFNRVLEDGDMD